MREVGAQKLNKIDIVMGACGGCYSFENQGRNIAGDFSTIAHRISYNRDTLVKYILNPESVKPGVAMPPQNVSHETAELIADFMLRLKIPKEVRQ